MSTKPLDAGLGATGQPIPPAARPSAGRRGAGRGRGELGPAGLHRLAEVGRRRGRWRRRCGPGPGLGQGDAVVGQALPQGRVVDAPRPAASTAPEAVAGAAVPQRLLQLGVERAREVGGCAGVAPPAGAVPAGAVPAGNDPDAGGPPPPRTPPWGRLKPFWARHCWMAWRSGALAGVVVLAPPIVPAGLVPTAATLLFDDEPQAATVSPTAIARPATSGRRDAITRPPSWEARPPERPLPLPHRHRRPRSRRCWPSPESL